MKRTVKLAGASYEDVETITLPLAAGGKVSYVEVSDTTATAADVACGKKFYTSTGELESGTSAAATYSDFDNTAF